MARPRHIGLANEDELANRDGLCCASVLEAPLSEEEAAELARVLSALADPVRLRLFSIVAARGEVCSCELEEPLGRSQPTISHHTKILAEAGLLSGEKRGRWMWWSIAPKRLSALGHALGGSGVEQQLR